MSAIIIPKREEIPLAFQVQRRNAKHGHRRERIPVMVGVHPSEGEWTLDDRQVALARNFQLLGNLLWKIQGPIGKFNEEMTIHYLLASTMLANGRSFLFYDRKLKDTASTLAPEIKRLIGLGAHIVSVWIDKEGLRHVIELLNMYPELAPYVCGVATLTTIDDEECIAINGMDRKSFLIQQTAPLVPLGMEHFISAVGEVQPVRQNIARLHLPQPCIHCPAIRLPGEDPGGQKNIATHKEALLAEATSIIRERSLTNHADVIGRWEIEMRAAAA